jgi:hypothetical protein
MAIDPKHLPEDPKTLQQMVLDPWRNWIANSANGARSLLRELLDAKRNRKSESFPTNNWLCLRHCGKSGKRNWKQRIRLGNRTTMMTKPTSTVQAQPRQRSAVAARLCHGISSASASCTILPKGKSTVPVRTGPAADW